MAKYPDALNFADDSLKRDREVVMTAIAKDPAALRYAHESLRQDPDIIQAQQTAAVVSPEVAIE